MLIISDRYAQHSVGGCAVEAEPFRNHLEIEVAPMTTTFLQSLRRVAVGLTLALAAHGIANAGLVRGSWDPEFGGTFTNLSWQVRAEFLIPNGCSNAADGVYSTSQIGGPCESTLGDPVRLLALWVRWFNTDAGDPNNFFQQVFPISAYTGYCESVWASSQPDCNLGNTTFFNQGSEPLSAFDVRVEANQIVGFNTGVIAPFQTFGWPDSAGSHDWSLGFTVNGPVLTCIDCDPQETADTTDLTQFLVTYTDDAGAVPKFTDQNGNALGAVLDGQGVYVGQAAVPEPGTLVLALAALTAIGWSRRRRRA